MATKTTTTATEKKTAVKKFKNTDLIACQSITNGELLMVGAKTGNLYRWADFNDIEDVEYQDIIYDMRSARDGYVKKPRFIVLNEHFLKQNPEIESLYGNMYSSADLNHILDLPPGQLKDAVNALPAGAKESMLGIASTMIDAGMLDSVQKIKILDEIYGTQMLLTLSGI